MTRIQVYLAIDANENVAAGKCESDAAIALAEEYWDGALYPFTILKLSVPMNLPTVECYKVTKVN